MEGENKPLIVRIGVVISVVAALLVSEFVGSLHVSLFLVILFLPYFLSTLCVSGFTPYTHDCVALLTHSPSWFGVILTLLLVCGITTLGFYFWIPFLVSDFRRVQSGFSGDWKGLLLAVFLVVAGIGAVIVGALYFGS